MKQSNGMRPRVPVVVRKCGLSEWTLNFQTVAPEQSVSTDAAIAALGRLCKRHQNAFHRYLRKTISDGDLAPLATMNSCAIWRDIRAGTGACS
jgi:hypothetical protein